MSDDAEFKSLVRRRMRAAEEKYSTALRALVKAAEPAIFPLVGRQVLPRIAAEFADHPPKPTCINVELQPTISLRLDEDELAQYVAADENGREDLVLGWLADRLGDMVIDEGLLLDHAVIYEDQLADERVRREADYLEVTPDQYAWLVRRLTDDEFSRLTDEDMHQLLADEYTEYPVRDNRSAEAPAS